MEKLLHNKTIKPKTISDKDGVRKQEYASTTTGPVLTVLLLEGHGHQWPGSKSLLPESTLGPNTSKLNATDELWDFFKSVKQ